MKKLEPAEIRRLAAIALWWLCVGIVLSNLLSVLLQNLTEWIVSLVLAARQSPYLYYIGSPSLNCRPDEAARGLYTVDKLRDTQREEHGEMRLPPAGKGSAEGKRGRRYSSLPG